MSASLVVSVPEMCEILTEYVDWLGAVVADENHPTRPTSCPSSEEDQLTDCITSIAHCSPNKTEQCLKTCLIVETGDDKDTNTVRSLLYRTICLATMSRLSIGVLDFIFYPENEGIHHKNLPCHLFIMVSKKQKLPDFVFEYEHTATYTIEQTN